jgi:hypothetical protein
MKTIIVTAAALLLSGPAWAQAGVPNPPFPTDPSNVPAVINSVNNAGVAAGITQLDIGSVQRLPLFNQPGPGGSPGTLSVMRFNIGTLLNEIKPAP